MKLSFITESLAVIALAVTLSNGVRADDGAAPADGPAAKEGGFHQAFDACAEKYGRPERGQRPSDNFIACMKTAGYDGPPHHRHHRRPANADGAAATDRSSADSSSTQN